MLQELSGEEAVLFGSFNPSMLTLLFSYQLLVLLCSPSFDAMPVCPSLLIIHKNLDFPASFASLSNFFNLSFVVIPLNV